MKIERSLWLENVIQTLCLAALITQSSHVCGNKYYDIGRKQATHHYVQLR